MIRVGINGRTFSVAQPGGSVQAAIEFSRQLVRASSIDSVVYGHRSAKDLFDGVAVKDTLFPVRSQAFGVIWERSVLPVAAQRDDLDVLFCPNANAPLHDCRTPTVLCIHDVGPERGWSSETQAAYRRLTLPHAVAAADAVTTVSEFSKREIVDVFDVDPDDVHVVHNGIDELYHNDDPGEPVSLPEQYVLYVGAMNPRKNLRRALAAYERLQERTDLPQKLVLVGPDNKTVFQNINLDADQDVVFPGFLSERELKYTYANADVFLYPSLYEGFGLPPLEALACGTPVVASNRASLPEVLIDPVPTVDPTNVDAIADAVEAVLTNDRFAAEIVRAGRARATMFTWERAGRELLEVVEKTVGNSE